MKTKDLYWALLLKNKSFFYLVQNSESPKSQKLAFFIDCSLNSKSSSNVSTSLISFTKVSMRNLTLVTSDLFANFFTLGLASESGKSENCKKDAVCNDLSRYSNSVFYVTIGLISSIEVSVESFALVEAGPFRKNFNLTLALES